MWSKNEIVIKCVIFTKLKRADWILVVSTCIQIVCSLSSERTNCNNQKQVKKCILCLCYMSGFLTHWTFISKVFMFNLFWGFVGSILCFQFLCIFKSKPIDTFIVYSSLCHCHYNSLYHILPTGTCTSQNNVVISTSGRMVLWDCVVTRAVA